MPDIVDLPDNTEHRRCSNVSSPPETLAPKCQTAEILGENVADLALYPSPTGPLPMEILKALDFAIDVTI